MQLASKEKLQPPEIERPVYVKGWCCRLVDPASTVILEFHLGTDVRTRQCVINLFLKLVYYWDIPGNMLTFSFNCVLLHCKK